MLQLNFPQVQQAFDMVINIHQEVAIMSEWSSVGERGIGILPILEQCQQIVPPGLAVFPEAHGSAAPRLPGVFRQWCTFRIRCFPLQLWWNNWEGIQVSVEPCQLCVQDRCHYLLGDARSLVAENHQVIYLHNELVTDHESRLHDVIYKVLWLLSHTVVRQSPIRLPATGSVGFRLLRWNFVHYRL